MRLFLDLHNGHFNRLCVYAPTNLTERKDFFANLHEFFFPAAGRILGGDFNCYKNALDKFGGNVNINNELSDLKSTFHFVDIWRKIHPNKREFTWFNTDFSIASRLDKFYLSSNIVNSVSLSSIIPCCFSDHDYVNVHLELSHLPLRGPGVWKFINSLLQDPTFCNFIRCRISDLSSSISCFDTIKNLVGIL